MDGTSFRLASKITLKELFLIKHIFLKFKIFDSNLVLTKKQILSQNLNKTLKQTQFVPYALWDFLSLSLADEKLVTEILASDWLNSVNENLLK